MPKNQNDPRVAQGVAAGLDWAERFGHLPGFKAAANAMRRLATNRGYGSLVETETPIPERLDTPEFRAAWERWKKYRRGMRKTLRPETELAQLKKLAKCRDVAVAIASIEMSIEQGWQGLFNPHGGSGTVPTTQSDGAKPMPMDDEMRRAIAASGK